MRRLVAEPVVTFAGAARLALVFPGPSAPFSPPDQDAEHLRLLAIFHYIWAALLAVMSLIPVVHLALGIAMLTGVFPTPPASHSGGPPVQWVGWFFVAIGGSIIVFGETLAALTFAAGRSLSQRRRRTFVIVIAVLNCFHMPIGTALGVFTILVLSRPTVKNAFDAGV